MRGLAHSKRSTALSNGMDAKSSAGVPLSSPAAAQRCAEGAGLDSGTAAAAQSAMPSIAAPCHRADRRSFVHQRRCTRGASASVSNLHQLDGRDQDRCEGLLADAAIVHVKLSQLQLRRPRQWGACWLALLLWRELQLEQFWSKRLGVSRKGTRWDQVLFVLVAYRLLAPGSEWRLHREWFQRSALADLLGEDAGLAEIHKLYRCHDRLLVHKQAVFDHLTRRWRDLFNVSYDVLLYDLTST